MDHSQMHSCCHTMSQTPEWLLVTLAALFFAGFGFYMYRLFAPAKVKSVYGYADRENEIGHGICMLSMAAMLAPTLIQLSASAWTYILSFGCVWFLLRAVTWGRKLPYNVWWYDWAHVGMLGGMTLMFHPLNLGMWFVILQLAFWGWFAAYYTKELYHDLKTPNMFSLGSDISHLSMGVAMFIMTAWPMALMPNMDHSMSESQQHPAMISQAQVVPLTLKTIREKLND